MSRRRGDKGPATALSPYLSLREAVRPAIYAFSLLAREKDQAAALVSEANELLRATQDLLEATGLVQILSPDSQEEAVFGKDGVDSQVRLVAAYSEAGMRWARIVGICLAIADALVAEARWEDARRLASYLKAAREPSAAEDVGARIEAAQQKAEAEAFQARYSAVLGSLNDHMDLVEVQKAISTLREAREDPAVSHQLETALRKPLLASLAKYASRSRQKSSGGTTTIYEEIESLEGVMAYYRQERQDDWEGIFNYVKKLYDRWG